MTPGTVYRYLDHRYDNRTIRNFILFCVDPNLIRGKESYIGDIIQEISNSESIMCLYERRDTYKNRQICDRLVLTSSGQLGWVLVQEETINVIIDSANNET